MAGNRRVPLARSGTSGSGSVSFVTAPSWRASTVRSVVMVISGVPSPPSLLNESVLRSASYEVDTEGPKLLGEVTTQPSWRS